LTDTAIEKLTKLLVNGDRVNALRLCNRVLKKTEPTKRLLSGQKQFWEQIQFELKKPDSRPIEISQTKNHSYFVDPSQREFVRIISNKDLPDKDFDYLLENYEAQATVLSYAYFNAHYHFRMMQIAKELRKK
jgi:hypothetical protein